LPWKGEPVERCQRDSTASYAVTARLGPQSARELFGQPRNDTFGASHV
jgi:hypothetical protein